MSVNKKLSKTKLAQSRECLSLLDALEEWLNDNKEGICYYELINLVESYRDYYGKDGDFL